MFRKSMRLVPAVRAYQARSIWDWRPNDVRSIMREIDRDFANMERQFFRNSPLRFLAPRFIPIEGKEMKNESYRINLDVQGFKPEDIKVSINDGVLKIMAEMDKKSDDGGRIQQSIVREFTLPTNVDPGTVKSLLHGDGILSIEASLAKPEEPKEIPIESGESLPKSKI